jgi:phage FluMu protein Com
MKHYAIDQWADFTRGMLATEERMQMQAHLHGGCPKCRQVSEFTAKLTDTCTNLVAESVPESTVRLARAIFPVRVADRPKRGNRLPIELIFDSFLVPSPVGLRATWQVGWQGLYRAGDCSVDLRIEPELKSSRAAVIGQITNHVLPELEMGNLPVCLRSGKVVVAETLSNRFGEFQMEYDQQSQLKLCIDLRDAKSIQVPLKRFTSDQPVTKSRTSPRKRTSEKQ